MSLAVRILFINIIFMCKIFTIIDSADNGSKSLRRVAIEDIKNVFRTPTRRIVGGKPANIKSYPFAVSVQWSLGSKHHCGGSYIRPRFVLSAAHCMVKYHGHRWSPENPRYYLILAGTSNLWYSPTWQIATTDAVLPHPGFNYGSMAHDIGLYRTTQPFRETPYVTYAPLPTDLDSHLFTRRNETCTVIGWGKTSETSIGTSDILRHVDVPLIPTRECSRYFVHSLHPSQICAGRKEGGVDACQGDSGGPMMCAGVQVGIVSWGHGCAAPHSPGVYARVDQYMQWIQKTMMKNQAHAFKGLSLGFFVFPLLTCNCAI